MAKTYLDSLLGDYEEIIDISRQHWFILASSIILELFLILLILAATATAVVFFTPFAMLIIVVGFALLLLPTATMTRDILDWSHRQYIITNRRVMQIAGVLDKQVTDSSLEKVNDVKMRQSALGRIFNYGDIHILTASELGVNRFKRIEDPVGFKTTMINAKEKLDRGETLPGAGGDIPALIAHLDHLREGGILSDQEFQAKKTELLSRL